MNNYTSALASVDASRDASLPIVSDTAQAPLKTKRGQKYHARPERHSQQTHPRAEARAVAQGHTSMQEQHAHDRANVVAKLDKRTAQQLRQQQDGQKKRTEVPQTVVAEKRPEEEK